MRKGIIGFASLLASAVLAIAAIAHAGDTVTYYYNDAQGSPVVTADAQGNVIERTDYAPYGATLNRPVHDGPGYTGHEEDSATGLTYMQQRYYDSQSGQFISTDPVLPDGSTGASFNRYAYANDNPYRYTDPDGRQEASDADADAVKVEEMRESQYLTPISSEEIQQQANFNKLMAPPREQALEAANPDMSQTGSGDLLKDSQLKLNQAQGKSGEAATREKLGEKVAGEQVTFKTSDGTRARPDFVTKDQGIVESKTGNARLSRGQAKLKADVEAGRQVTPVGQNAAKAGLRPGKPTTMKSCTVDRC